MKKIFYLFSLLILFSCGPKNNELVILFEESAGLQEGSDVIWKNKLIGNVTNIRQDGNYDIHVRILLIEMGGLPKDSKFTIRNKDLLNKALYVTLGKSKQYFSKSDRIVGEIETLFYIKKREI